MRKTLSIIITTLLINGCTEESQSPKTTENTPQTSPTVVAPEIGTPNIIHQPSISLNKAMPLAKQKIAPIYASEAYHIEYHTNQEQYPQTTNNKFVRTSEQQVSTFSIDVDTTAYGIVRRNLNNDTFPPKDAIRTEELINYFDYNYPVSNNKKRPFEATIALYPSPWNQDTKLLHIGLKGYEIKSATKPPSNLVFLIDTSGSMNSEDKLGLLRKSLKLMVNNLNKDDTVAIVTYAGTAGIVLKPTRASEKETIFTALDNLSASGSTAGQKGIETAYNLAKKHYLKKGINRVILATDGDFNVGLSDPSKLTDFIEKKRKTGIYLSVLGFGMGNYRDDIMQSLAQNGNGNAAYIDNLNEAQKVLADEASATLYPIANDVKIQIEFNPAKVAEYRLIGYETRILSREDFNDDRVDAGEIGSGHTVTAIYEITPAGGKGQLNDELRYKTKASPTQTNEQSNEYAFLKVRYKLPGKKKSKLYSIAIDQTFERKDLSSLDSEIRFATAVAAFGQKLKQSKYTENFSYKDIINLAKLAKGADQYGYRQEFINLVNKARIISTIE